MSPQLTESPFFIAALALGAFGAIQVLAGIAALIQARPFRFALRTLSGLLLLSLGGLAGALAVGIQGYRTLAHEEIAARVSVRPDGPMRFAATFLDADGRKATYALAGDEIYVDAHILKWKPLANALGLHTAYELDRVAGRYRDIGQERYAARTVHSLGQQKPVDLFGLRQRHAFLAPFLDAEYGSATFVPVTQPAELELRVSASGLLFRETNPAAKSP